MEGKMDRSQEKKGAGVHSTESRIYGKQQEINPDEVKQLYIDRAVKSRTVHVDAPVVLCSDVDVDNIEAWNSWELEKWFPMFRLDEESVVFELGFGTGRMTKYIVPTAKQYVGVDYVEEFTDIIRNRSDIQPKENTLFLNDDFESFLRKADTMDLPKFTHFFCSGGVFMYMNDEVVQRCIEEMERFLADKCIIYISEPVALEERLTLNSFYSEQMSHDYSAIYRTEEQYKTFFRPLLEKGFSLEVSELFFGDDIKKQKETQQWIFILER